MSHLRFSPPCYLRLWSCGLCHSGILWADKKVSQEFAVFIFGIELRLQFALARIGLHIFTHALDLNSCLLCNLPKYRNPFPVVHTSTPKIEAEYPFEILVSAYKITRCDNSEDHNVNFIKYVLKLMSACISKRACAKLESYCKDGVASST